jgi:hypothetical protein
VVIIRDDHAQQREQSSGASVSSKAKKSVPKQKVGATARSSASKLIKSKVRGTVVGDSFGFTPFSRKLSQTLKARTNPNLPA